MSLDILLELGHHGIVVGCTVKGEAADLDQRDFKNGYNIIELELYLVFGFYQLISLLNILNDDGEVVASMTPRESVKAKYSSLECNFHGLRSISNPVACYTQISTLSLRSMGTCIDGWVLENRTYIDLSSHPQ